MTDIDKFISDLSTLWTEIGYNKEQRTERTLKIRNEINITLEKSFNSEREEKIQIESNLAKWAEDIVKIAKRLGKPIPNYDVTNKSLLQRIDIIQNVRNNLISQKNEKEGELKGLLNTLTMTIKAIGSNGLQGEKYKSLENLSDAHIQEIRTYANDMAKVRDDILSKSQETISDIKRLSEEMSEPLNELICSLDGSASVTAEQLSALTAERKRLSALREQRSQEIDKCLTKLRKMSEETGIPGIEEVERFSANMKILSSENVKRCHNEIMRQEEARKDVIKSEIRELIKELRGVWDEIGYERKTIDAHGATFDTKSVEGLETLLKYYKSQLELFKGLKELSEQIIELIENRNEILREWEYLSDDKMKPHLTGRSAEDTKIRLEYMRTQSKLSKIPRIEGSILDKLFDWKERTGTCFEYDGIDYIEKIHEDELSRKSNPIYKNTKAAFPPIRRRKRSIKPSSSSSQQQQQGTQKGNGAAVVVETVPTTKGGMKRQLNATYTAPSSSSTQQQQQQQKGGVGFTNTVAVATPRGVKSGKEGGKIGTATATAAVGGKKIVPGSRKEGGGSSVPKQRTFGVTTATGTAAAAGTAKGLMKKKSIKRKSVRGLESHKPIKKSRRLK